MYQAIELFLTIIDLLDQRCHGYSEGNVTRTVNRIITPIFPTVRERRKKNNVT
jgi:hypothetical protein